MNILYICTPNSIHDQKWMSYFAEKKEYNVFVVGESQCSQDLVQELADKNMELLPSISPFSIAHPLKNYQSIQHLKSYIRKYKIDLVHVLFATPYALWTNYIKIPYFITTRGSDVLVVLPGLLKQKGIKGFYFHWLFKQFKKAFINAKYVTSTSEAQLKEIKALFGRTSVELIRTGIDVEKVAKTKDVSLLNPLLQKQKFIFSPRFFAPVYNIQLQIDALALLPNKIINDYYFVFIKGFKFDKEYAVCLLKELSKLKSKIGLKYLVIDYLDQETLWAYFNNASLTIQSPISDGTPNSALEAMAAKCPLIMPDIEKLDKDLFEGTCVKFKEYDSAVVADLITQSLNGYPKAMIDTAYEKVNQFGNREIEMRKLNEIYSHF